jgi:hypothetical protein
MFVDASGTSYSLPMRSFPVENKIYAVALNMTGRGQRGLPPLRPTTPTDPTLVSRPVPRKRAFPIRWYGPGAAIDTNTTDYSDRNARKAFWEELDRAAGAESGKRTRFLTDVEHLLRIIKKREAATYREDRPLAPQPTWGFYVFLLDYDQETRENVPRAMENWVKAIQLDLRPQYPGDSKVYSDEAFARLRLDLVDDEEALDNASIDRVRECFRALVRSFELADDDDDDNWAGPPRNKTCLVLNTQKVQMLANLKFSEDEDDFDQIRAFLKCHVTAVDIRWQRPKTTRDKWRGFRDFNIICLGRKYQLLGSNFLLDDLSD